MGRHHDNYNYYYYYYYILILLLDSACLSLSMFLSLFVIRATWARCVTSRSSILRASYVFGLIILFEKNKNKNKSKTKSRSYFYYY